MRKGMRSVNSEMIMSFGSKENLYRLRNALLAQKVPSRVVSTPVRVFNSCGLSLAIRSADYVLALNIASGLRVKIVAVYMKKGGGRTTEYVKVQNLQK